MPYFFRKVTHRVRIEIGVTSKVLTTVNSLLDTGANPNLINKDFLPLFWKKSAKSIQLLQRQADSCKVEKIEGNLPLLIRTDELLVCDWLRIVEKLAVEVLLRTSLFDQFICGIFPNERKVISWQSKPVQLF